MHPCRYKMSICLDLRIAVLLSGSITVYFYFHPRLPIEISFMFWSIFVFFYFLDVRITTSNSYLIDYEKNIIFSTLYKKLGSKISSILQCGIEICIMIFLPFLFIAKIGFTDISVIAAVFGISHLLGYNSNKKIISLIKRG